MEVKLAASIIDLIERGSLNEIEDLVEIQNLCFNDLVFKSNLALECGMSNLTLDFTIREGIADILAQSVQMERRECRIVR